MNLLKSGFTFLTTLALAGAAKDVSAQTNEARPHDPREPLVKAGCVREGIHAHADYVTYTGPIVDDSTGRFRPSCDVIKYTSGSDSVTYNWYGFGEDGKRNNQQITAYVPDSLKSSIQALRLNMDETCQKKLHDMIDQRAVKGRTEFTAEEELAPSNEKVKAFKKLVGVLKPKGLQ
jgi:polyhydroxyalkanoate synthesis regulator phasin